MTSRAAQMKAWREYREALQEAERKKPLGCSFYKISAENGSEDGRLIYEPNDDSVSLHVPGVEAKISGVYLRSLYSALGDLVG